MTSITARGTSTRHYAAERATLSIHIAHVSSDRFSSISDHSAKHNSALSRVRELEDSGDATWTHSSAPSTYSRTVPAPEHSASVLEETIEYVTSSRVLVKVANLSRVSELIREFNTIGLTSVSWALTEVSRKEYESYARRRSVEKAREIAEDYAIALGKQIVSVTSISDQAATAHAGATRGGAGAASAAAAEVSIPEISVSASVIGEYSAE